MNPVFAKTIAGLCAFGIILLLINCGGGSSNSGGQSNLPSQPITSIVALGDSITAGAAISTAPWPQRLQQSLGVPVNSTTGPGQQTGWGLSTIDNLIDTNKPSHIVILLGTNDALSGSVNSAVANLQQMANIANNKGVVPVIGTIPILGLVAANNKASDISDAIQDITQARIANVRRAVGNDIAILADGIHPNDEGQQRIADAFRDAMQ